MERQQWINHPGEAYYAVFPWKRESQTLGLSNGNGLPYHTNMLLSHYDSLLRDSKLAYKYMQLINADRPGLKEGHRMEEMDDFSKEIKVCPCSIKVSILILFPIFN